MKVARDRTVTIIGQAGTKSVPTRMELVEAAESCDRVAAAWRAQGKDELADSIAAYGEDLRARLRRLHAAEESERQDAG